MLQEVVADLVRHGDARESVIGEFVATGPPPKAGQKRPRVQMKLTLNKARITEIAGPDASKRIPSRYTLTLEGPSHNKVLTHTAGAGFSVVGTVGRGGSVVPDVTDPAYGAYMSARRKKELEATAAKSAPRLADTPAALGVLAAATNTSETGALLPLASTSSSSSSTSSSAAAAAMGGADRMLVEAGGPPPIANRSVPRVATIYALFESGAYWSLREMAEAVGKKEVRALAVQNCFARCLLREARLFVVPAAILSNRLYFMCRCYCLARFSPRLQADVKPTIAQACDYMRAGPHKGKYRLKPEWRSVNSTAPDPNDGVATDE